MKMRVMGIVKEKESGNPLSGLIVCAYDKDLIGSDLLGRTETGYDGKFIIEYDSSEFQELLDKNPDIYLNIFKAEGSNKSGKKKAKPIFTTKNNIRQSASSSEKYYIEIPRKKLN
jgi:hypothetical protein